MALFPVLEGMSFERLLGYFSTDALYKDDPEERDLWLQEVAVRIAKNGSQGLSFLIRSIPNVDQSRLRAILLSFSFLSSEITSERRAEVKEILRQFLKSKDPMLISEAIQSLNSLGFTEVMQDILPFLAYKSPYVVGSALRFLSRHNQAKAIPVLLESLKSKEPIVRQNAIDELEYLGCLEALPYVRPLIYDEDKYVRQAAQTALATLGEKKWQNGK